MRVERNEVDLFEKKPPDYYFFASGRLVGEEGTVGIRKVSFGSGLFWEEMRNKYPESPPLPDNDTKSQKDSDNLLVRIPHELKNPTLPNLQTAIGILSHFQVHDPDKKHFSLLESCHTLFVEMTDYHPHTVFQKLNYLHDLLIGEEDGCNTGVMVCLNASPYREEVIDPEFAELDSLFSDLPIDNVLEYLRFLYRKKDDPEIEISRQKQKNEFLEARRNLKEEWQTIITFRILGYRYEEIASQMSMEENEVYKIFHQATDALREILQTN